MTQISNEIENKKQETRRLEQQNVSLNEDFKLINQKNKEKEELVSQFKNEIQTGFNFYTF